jgi:hypothetical protein
MYTEVSFPAGNRSNHAVVHCLHLLQKFNNALKEHLHATVYTQSKSWFIRDEWIARHRNLQALKHRVPSNLWTDLTNDHVLFFPTALSVPYT